MDVDSPDMKPAMQRLQTLALSLWEADPGQMNRLVASARDQGDFEQFCADLWEMLGTDLELQQELADTLRELRRAHSTCWPIEPTVPVDRKADDAVRFYKLLRLARIS